MIVDNYRNIPKELLLAMIKFDLAKKFSIDKEAHVSHFYSASGVDGLWEIMDRNSRVIYVYVTPKVPKLLPLSKYVTKLAKKTNLWFMDTLEVTKFDKSDKKNMIDDAEIVGRYGVKSDDLFIFILTKQYKRG